MKQSIHMDEIGSTQPVNQPPQQNTPKAEVTIPQEFVLNGAFIIVYFMFLLFSMAIAFTIAMLIIAITHLPMIVFFSILITITMILMGFIVETTIFNIKHSYTLITGRGIISHEEIKKLTFMPVKINDINIPWENIIHIDAHNTNLLNIFSTANSSHIDLTRNDSQKYLAYIINVLKNKNICASIIKTDEFIYSCIPDDATIIPHSNEVLFDLTFDCPAAGDYQIFNSRGKIGNYHQELVNQLTSKIRLSTLAEKNRYLGQWLEVKPTSLMPLAAIVKTLLIFNRNGLAVASARETDSIIGQSQIDLILGRHHISIPTSGIFNQSGSILIDGIPLLSYTLAKTLGYKLQLVVAHNQSLPEDIMLLIGFTIIADFQYNTRNRDEN